MVDDELDICDLTRDEIYEYRVRGTPKEFCQT
jgi:hypothetical protein